MGVADKQLSSRQAKHMGDRIGLGCTTISRDVNVRA